MIPIKNLMEVRRLLIACERVIQIFQFQAKCTSVSLHQVLLDSRGQPLRSLEVLQASRV